MKSFDPDRLTGLQVPAATAWLLSDISEAKGRFQSFHLHPPLTLEKLARQALVHSVESSNRIEGVEVAPQRLYPLVVGDATPTDRNESEVHGYRLALELIQRNHAELAVNPDLMLQFHAKVQPDSGDAGQWKRVDNEIVELKSGEAPIVRFRPTPADQTPQAAEALCRAYRYTLDQTKVPPLIADALFVLDFLCIHPFRDGNGRVSRLLSHLVLLHHGHEVGRYVAIERLIEESRVDYYRVLHQCSQRWHEAGHDPWPWVNFHLGIIHRAYKQLENPPQPGIASVTSRT